MSNTPTMKTAVLDGVQRQYDRALARVAEVAEKPDAQSWEVVQARESLRDAQRALDVLAAAYAMVSAS